MGAGKAAGDEHASPCRLVAAQALRLTMVQVLINSKGFSMNPMQSLYYVSPACLVCLLVPFRECGVRGTFGAALAEHTPPSWASTSRRAQQQQQPPAAAGMALGTGTQRRVLLLQSPARDAPRVAVLHAVCSGQGAAVHAGAHRLEAQP